MRILRAHRHAVFRRDVRRAWRLGGASADKTSQQLLSHPDSGDCRGHFAWIGAESRRENRQMLALQHHHVHLRAARRRRDVRRPPLFQSLSRYVRAAGVHCGRSLVSVRGFVEFSRGTPLCFRLHEAGDGSAGARHAHGRAGAFRADSARRPAASHMPAARSATRC